MKKNKMVTMHLIALLLLLVGLAVTTASTYVMITNYQKSKEYTETKAIVVAHENKKNGLKAIVVEYNVENKYYRLESKHYTKEPEAEGTEIRIKYNPKKPDDFIWVDNNHTHKYLISGLILLVGDGLIWLVLKLVGKKKVDVSTPAETEPKKDKPADVELPAPKKKEEPKEEKTEEKKEEVVATDSNLPLFEKEATPAIFAPLTDEEKEKVEKEKAKKAEAKKAEEVKEEKKEIPLIEEELELPVAHKKTKEEPKKEVIPEIPYDLDSPREAIVSNVMETTIAIPTINKELIDLPTPKKENKETKNVKINNNIKSDALTKLLEDIEKGKK